MFQVGARGVLNVYREPGGVNSGRAAVYGVIGRDGVEQIVKVYGYADRQFADVELKNLTLLGAAPRRIATPPALGAQREGDIVNFMGKLPGNALTDTYSPDGAPVECAQVICRAADKFAQTQVAASKDALLEFSEPQRMHFWSTPNPNAIADVTLTGHAEEFARDCARADQLPGWSSQKFLRSWNRGIAELPSWVDQVRTPVHHDLNSTNILLADNTEMVIDVPHAMNSTPLVEFGGAVSHCGLEARLVVAEAARGFYAGRGVNVRDGDLDAALKLFTMKRCMRAVAFLADLPESQRDAEVMTEVADRMQMMEGLVSSLSALGRE